MEKQHENAAVVLSKTPLLLVTYIEEKSPLGKAPSKL